MFFQIENFFCRDFLLSPGISYGKLKIDVTFLADMFRT